MLEINCNSGRALEKQDRSHRRNGGETERGDEMISYEEAFIPTANIVKVLDESQDYHTAKKSLIYNRRLTLHESDTVFWRVNVSPEDVRGTFRYYDLFDASDNCKRLQDDTALILFTPEFCAKLCRNIYTDIPEVLERGLCSETTILTTNLISMYWYMRICLQAYKENKMEHKGVFVLILRDFGYPGYLYDKVHLNVAQKK